MAEFAPFVEDSSLPSADQDFIMSTLFGQGNAADQNANGDQGGGGDSAAAKPNADKPGVAAPSSGASEGGDPNQAAQGGGGDKQELPAFPGTPAPPQSADAGQAQSPGQGGEPSPSAPAPAARPDPEMGLRLQNLEAQNAALQSQIRQLLDRGSTGQQGGQPDPSKPADTPADPAKEIIQLAAPADVVKAILGDDFDANQQAGINHLISATATAVYRRAMQDVSALVDNRLQSYQGQNEQQAAIQKMRDDYYGKFPDHTNPLFEPLIQSEYQALHASMPGLIWNEQTRDALGARVTSKLKELGFAVGMTPAAPAPANGDGQAPEEKGPVAGAAPKPPAMLGNGSRPAKEEGAGNFIAATFNG
jgi:hypothetical protein